MSPIISGKLYLHAGAVQGKGETILDIQIGRGSLEQHFTKIARGFEKMGAFYMGVSLQWKLDIRK